MRDVLYCKMVNGVILPVQQEITAKDAAYLLASKVVESAKVYTLAKAVDFLGSLGFTGQQAVQVIRLANQLLK